MGVAESDGMSYDVGHDQTPHPLPLVLDVSSWKRVDKVHGGQGMNQRKDCDNDRH